MEEAGSLADLIQGLAKEPILLVEAVVTGYHEHQTSHQVNAGQIVAVLQGYRCVEMTFILLYSHHNPPATPDLGYRRLKQRICMSMCRSMRLYDARSC